MDSFRLKMFFHILLKSVNQRVNPQTLVVAAGISPQMTKTEIKVEKHRETLDFVKDLEHLKERSK